MWEIETTCRFDDWYFSLGEVDRENVLAAILVLERKAQCYPGRTPTAFMDLCTAI